MRKYGLIGFPLGHSFSRKYFTEKFVNEQITGCIYENFPLSDIDLLPSLVYGEPELSGLNVTIPYKSEVIRFLDVIDKEASEIGSVNVIKIRRTADKVILSGFNSDVTGISESLMPYIDGSIDHAMVLGTGGSSRSACYVLRKFGFRITQVSREKKEGMITYPDILPDLLSDVDFIINTTPLGMFPATEGKPGINYNLLGKKHILFDLVYNPEITEFLKAGEAQGCTIISGMKMLYSQAEQAWRIWNDEKL